MYRLSRKFQRGESCRKREMQEPEKPPEPSFDIWKFWRSTDNDEPSETELCSQSGDGGSTMKSHLYALGAVSLSPFGLVGTLLQALLIFYVMLASVIGLYNLPGFRSLRPQQHETTMTKIIMNCLAMQLLSSSLPVLCRVLGKRFFHGPV